MDRVILQRVVPGALVLVAVLLSVVRPVPRFHSRQQGQSGVNQRATASEPTERNDDAAQLSHERDTVLRFAPIIGAALLIILKTRRLAFVPLTIRRLKIPSAPDPLPPH